MEDIKTSENVFQRARGVTMLLEGAEVIKCDRVSFIILDDRIIVFTKLQAFMLKPSDYYWNKRLDSIKVYIQLNQIQDLNDVAEACIDRSKGAPKRIIQWIPTQLPVML